MPTYRTLRIVVGVALGASLTVVGTVASSASPLASTSAATRHTATAAPNPNAPHVGTVAGLQTGRHISVNNPTSVRAFLQIHRAMLHPRSVVPGNVNTIHVYVGTSFNNLTNSTGSQATQSVSTGIKPANPGTTLYTPTMYPSGGSAGSCIEVSTAYFFGSQVVAAWDWCQAIRFVAQVTINKRFMNTYTQLKNYSVQIQQTKKSTNEWTAYLYNYKTAQWETLFKQSGTGQTTLSEGWDLYELYSELQGNGQSYACADLKGKRIESQDIQVKIGSTWETADPSNAGDDYDVPLGSFDCKSLRYQMITQFSHWKAIG